MKHTINCLDSLAKCTYPNLNIVIIDNGSNEGDVIEIKSSDNEFHLICLSSNRGFTGGNNVGIEYALKENFDYVMLLNNDTEVEPDFIDHLVDEISQDDSIGAIQPKINQLPERSRIWNGGGTLDKIWGRSRTIGFGKTDSGQFDQLREVDWITGCCLMVKSSVIREVGILDDDFFAYHEDVDWSIRMRKKGFRLLYNGKSVIYHEAGVATRSEKPSGMRTSAFVYYLNFKNRLLVVKKHSMNKLVHATVILIDAVPYLGYFLMRGRISKFKAVIKGVYSGLNYSSQDG
ncbi:MAG: glycosyltransferase family 2 protein [Cyclobacteriaceae bacterium]